MPNMKYILDEALKIEGALAVAIADWDAGLCLASAGGGPRLNIGAAAAGHCQVLKVQMANARSGDGLGVRELLLTLEDQVHLIRPLHGSEPLFLCLAIDRATGNLGIARHRLQGLEAGLEM